MSPAPVVPLDTGAPVFEFVTGKELRGGESIIVNAKFKKYDAATKRFLDDNDSEITAWLMTNAEFKKPAYRTLVAECTRRGRGGECTIVFHRDVLLPGMLPILFRDTPPLLVITQGAHGRTVHPLAFQA